MRRSFIAFVVCVSCGSDAEPSPSGGPADASAEDVANDALVNETAPTDVAEAGSDDTWNEGLGEGVQWGLAAKYPDDVGIEKDPDVFGAESFESGKVVIPTEEDRYAKNVVVTSAQAYVGKHAGEHRWPSGLQGPTTRFVLPKDAHGGKARPAYFMRMAFKYDPSFHPGDPSRSVGVKGFGIYCEKVPANVNTPCDGTNWYDVSMQFVGWGPSAKPEANDKFIWEGHMYSYNPYPQDAVATLGELAVSKPSVGTKPYRFSSYPAPRNYIKFGTWHLYELGLYLNTPGKRDGEARFWIDGVLRARVTSMTYRDIVDLYPTHMHLNLHRTTDEFPQTMIRWVDQIVLARRYVGPVKRKA